MPTAAGVPIFEDLVAFLQQKPNPASFLHNMDMIAGSLADLANRVRNLEHASLEAAHANKMQQDAQADHETRLASVEADRKTAQAKIAAVEAAPLDVKKQLDDMDKRIRTVEGAVGSTGFKAAQSPDGAKPAVFAGVKPTDPVAPATT